MFSRATRRWFRRSFDGPTDAQALGWPAIAAGHHVLLTAPTGSGKTLAAFLWAIDRLLQVPAASPAAESGQGVAQAGALGTRVLYVSPLKALVVDIERNLRAPLAGIAHEWGQDAVQRPIPRVAVRTGDTPARERQRQLREPAEILVTTPESLYLLLGSRAAENLGAVETVILDEVHALAATKRGAHLALSLERLSALVTEAGHPEPQRIGLSATVQPLAEAAAWLGGDRPVEIIDAAAPPRLDLRVSVPVPDMERPPTPPQPAVDPEGGPILGELFARERQRPTENPLAEKGLWAALYPALLSEILRHRSTIIFVNSRGLCERLAQRLNALAAPLDAMAGTGDGADAGDAEALADGQADAPLCDLWDGPLARLDGLDADELDLDAAAAGLTDGVTDGGHQVRADLRAKPARAAQGVVPPGREQAAGQGAGPEVEPGAELLRAHHGSVSHQQRAEIEDALKRGALKAIVATSSLEMGIDMGGVDQVLLVESPGSVARGLQRVGRAGHGVGEVSSGRIFPKYRGDLLECAVIAGRMLRGEIEPLRMPRQALDVLAQQLVAHCVSAPRTVDELLRLVNRAGPYRGLSRAALEAVLDMLSGRYPSSDFADLRPLLSWDRATDVLSPRKGAAMVTRLNAGTIPDRGHYGVHLGTEGPRIGELDEEMVFELRAGECVLLGASTWRVEDIRRDRVVVTPAPGEPGKLPFWRGDGPGRPVELGRALGAFCRELAEQGRAAAVDWICAQTPLDRMAAQNLAAYIQEQREATGQVPSDRTLVIERFHDELGDWRICLLTPFGAPIHGPWAMALQWYLERREGFEVQVMYTDDGIVVRFADGEALPDLSELLPDPEELEERVTEQLADTALFASLFRENAGRALLLPRRSAKGRQPLWAQRLKAQNLLAVVRRYPAFPILLETYRQALSDVFDLPGLKSVLRGLRSRAIRVHEVETPRASPFARSLVFAYVAAYIYEQDAPLAERRAQALALDRGLLAELLGEAELRALIDPEVLEALEHELQHLPPPDDGEEDRFPGSPRTATQDGIDRRARDADELHDLLRRLGDLNEPELRLRCVVAPAGRPAVDAESGNATVPSAPGPVGHQSTWPVSDGVSAYSLDDPTLEDAADPIRAWLALLARQRRTAQVRFAGEQRWIAAEDAGLYRDALGVVPPAGLPDAFIAPTEAPLEQLLRRYARTHGPFTGSEIASRYGLRPAQVEPVLRLMEQQGLLVHGEIRPNGTEAEWCDAEVMRRLRRRTLARARDQVAPVDGPTLGRFLPAWHGIGEGRGGPNRLLEALTQLEGLSLSWTQLDLVLLPARVPGYRSEDLDLLAATGQILWVGRGALGPKDGRIALYRPEHALAAMPIPEAPSSSPAMAARPAVSGGGALQALQPATPADGPTAVTERGEDARVGALILAYLRRRGACFLFELRQAVEAGLAGQGDVAEAFETALWDRVWAGEITNDTFAPLRALSAPGRGHSRPRRPAPGSRFGANAVRGRHLGAPGGRIMGRRGPGAGQLAGQLAGGRWSLVADLAGAEIPLLDSTQLPVMTDAGEQAIGPRMDPAETEWRDAQSGVHVTQGLVSEPPTPTAAPGSVDGQAAAGVAGSALATEQRLLQVEMLLERYGLLSREVVAAEGIPGGFGPIYRVLRELEDVGRVRRGYFVEGLSGAQFALPGAIERLRALRQDEAPIDGFSRDDVRILSAADPANPYGALLGWPQTGQADCFRSAAGESPEPIGQTGAGPKRVPGAWVILVAGKLMLYLSASGKQLLTFSDQGSDEGHAQDLALAALLRLPRRGRKRLRVEQIDGVPALQSPLREALLGAGFEADYDGLAPAPGQRGADLPRPR